MTELKEIAKELETRKRYWISFIGDSLTSCEWVHPNWRDIVIYVLQNELIPLLNNDWKTVEWGLKGFNFAYDGATTSDVLDHVSDFLSIRPSLVISLMGGNDPVLDVSVEKSVENIQSIYRKVKEHGSRLIWSNSTPSGYGSKKNEEYEPYARAFMEMPLGEYFTRIDMFTEYKKYPLEKFFTFTSEENPVEGIEEGDPDFQHPNQLGNAYIAKVILEKGFGVNFDPERYIVDTLSGKKYPGY